MFYRQFLLLMFGLAIIFAAVPQAHAQASSSNPVTEAVNPLTGPSFPCPQPKDPLAQLVCSTPQLSQLDMQFVQAFEALLQQTGSSGQAATRHLDIQFDLNVRKTCNIAPSEAANTTDAPPPPAPAGAASCAIILYQQQIDTWKSMLQGAALEEANRSTQDQVALQSQLQKLGFLPQQSTNDGVFGTGTRGAIIAWQQSVGRQPTGLLGNDDAQALMAQTPPAQQDSSAQASPTESATPQARAAAAQVGTENLNSAPGTGAIIPGALQGVWASDCVGAANSGAPYMIFGPTQVMIVSSGSNSSIVEASQYLSSNGNFIIGEDSSFDQNNSQAQPSITEAVFSSISQNEMSLIGSFSASTGVVPGGSAILNKCVEAAPFSAGVQQVSNAIQPTANEISAAKATLVQIPSIGGVTWSAVTLK